MPRNIGSVDITILLISMLRILSNEKKIYCSFMVEIVLQN
jgi:hypothetical protein